MNTLLAFEWVKPGGYALAAVGFVLLGALLIRRLTRKDKERTEERERRLQAAIEDETADPADDVLTAARVASIYDDLQRKRAEFSDQQWWASDEEHRTVPEWTDPPTSRPYIVRCDRPTYVDRWEP